jgi:hypothetical protein
LRSQLARPRLSVWACPGCSHQVAIHAPGSAPRPGQDYHAQYDTGAFLSSLERTRRRQARVLAGTIRELTGGEASILDYGSGRGWFLQTCRDEGFRTLAGADTSEISVRLLGEAGIAGVLLPAAPSAFPFAPEVVTFLDVVEHFDEDDLPRRVAEIVSSVAPSARLVVVKVPDSAGLLYRAAVAMARLGVDGLLEQMYQVGTSPPHHHYFSRRSMREAMRVLGWEVIREVRDVDFEPSTMYQRVRGLSRLPVAIGAVPGVAADLLARSLGMADSSVYFIRR